MYIYYIYVYYIYIYIYIYIFTNLPVDVIDYPILGVEIARARKRF